MKTGKTTFLSFTICPSFDDAYNKSIFLQYDTNKSLYVNDGYFIPNTTEFYDAVTYNLTEILSKVGITTGKHIFIMTYLCRFKVNINYRVGRCSRWETKI